jgi:hypothetical protein
VTFSKRQRITALALNDLIVVHVLVIPSLIVALNIDRLKDAMPRFAKALPARKTVFFVLRFVDGDCY